MKLERFAIRNFIFLSSILVLLGTSIIFSQNIEPASGPQQSVSNEEEPVPYAQVCFANHGFNLDLHMGGHQLFQSGEGIFNTSSTQGTKINLRDDLGLERSSSEFYLGLDASLYAFRLSFDFTRSLFDGDRNLNRNITIDGITYSIDTKLLTDIEIDWYRLIMGYSLYTSSKFAFGLDLAFDLGKLKYDFRGVEASTGNAVRKAEVKYLPLVKPGIHMDFSFVEPLIFSLAINGIVFDQRDIKVESVYIELTSRCYFTDNVFMMLQGGYDYLFVQASDNDKFNGDITFNSWFASAGVGVHF